MAQDQQVKPKRFWKEHSLTVVAMGILALWFGLYVFSDPSTHAGSFFGNAIADWTGVVIMILGTKWFYEKGSPQSRQPANLERGPLARFLRQHSLTIVLFITGLGWILLFLRVDPDSRWGTVVSNIVSEWSQLLGLILLTKKFVEVGSKSS